MARGKRTLILTWNCESLPSKKLDADILIAEKNPVAFCFQDTRLTADTESEYNFTGYTPYFKSVDTSASGVAI